MDELTLDGEAYVSTKRAAKITGYAKDYIGQLCREGRVKARLVGRNWYVLEESIREHRFGESLIQKSAELAPDGTQQAEKTPEKPESPVNSWEAPQYAPESTPELPVIDKQAGKSTSFTSYRPLEVPIEAATAAFVSPDAEKSAPEAVKAVTNASDVLREMQFAWQDWFKQKEEEKLIEETLAESLIESPEVVNARAQTSQTQQIQPEAVPEPEVNGFQEEEEVSIPIHRSYTSQKDVKENPGNEVEKAAFSAETPTFPKISQVKSIDGWERKRVTAAERRAVVREHKGSNLVVKALLIGIMFIAIAITAIGSGYLNQYFNRDSFNYFPLQYLEGERVIDKSLK